MTREEFALALLDAIKAPRRDTNVTALVSWMQAEGSAARFNPLATTQPYPGATAFNSVGVKNYIAAADGVAATAACLNYGADRDLYGYREIRDRLRRGSRPASILRAVEGSQWGTGGLARKCLPFVRRDFDTYASKPVAS